MNIVLLGAPGSGKGTQAEQLCATFGLTHVSSGDLFRDHLGRGTELGELARGYMSRGDLVPDEVTIGMIRERLAQPDVDAGVLFDGFPRTVAQAEALAELLAESGGRVDGAVLLQVADETIVDRLASRGREDDTAETVLARLDTFRAQTVPVIEHYRAQGRFTEVDGEGAIDEIAARAAEAVRALQ